uniref:Cobyrinic acid a,c-diamide synthase n=1 Tax=Mycobacterium sp. (strain JLS) TaxID=164757 RepID=A0A5Q5CDK3_MYCSJ
MARVTRVLAVANQKGGVAKTTTVASLGAAMAESGKRVLLVDLDPQGSLTFSLGHDPDKLPVSVHEVLLGEVEPDAALVDTPEGMTLLPANIDLAGAEAMLLMRAGREHALKRAMAKLTGTYDVVLIDCPPSLGVLTLNGLTAAHEVIVPLQCETLAHRGVGQFLRTVSDVQAITNPDLKMLGALPTLYDSRTTHSRDVLFDVGPLSAIEADLIAIDAGGNDWHMGRAWRERTQRCTHVVNDHRGHNPTRGSALGPVATVARAVSRVHTAFPPPIQATRRLPPESHSPHRSHSTRVCAVRSGLPARAPSGLGLREPPGVRPRAGLEPNW